MIYWTAKNNSSFLNGVREARTMLAAVRAARRYVDGELYGDGIISFYDDKNDYYTGQEPIRSDSKTIFTNYKWVARDE